MDELDDFVRGKDNDLSTLSASLPFLEPQIGILGGVHLVRYVKAYVENDERKYFVVDSSYTLTKLISRVTEIAEDLSSSYTLTDPDRLDGLDCVRKLREYLHKSRKMLANSYSITKSIARLRELFSNPFSLEYTLQRAEKCFRGYSPDEYNTIFGADCKPESRFTLFGKGNARSVRVVASTSDFEKKVDKVHKGIVIIQSILRSNLFAFNSSYTIRRLSLTDKLKIVAVASVLYGGYYAYVQQPMTMNLVGLTIVSSLLSVEIGDRLARKVFFSFSKSAFRDDLSF